MASEESPERHRFCLPPGTVVEHWRLLGCHGHGAHGIVYRAVRVGHEAAGFVALKMARLPWDPCFMREVGLLSLVHHPSIPRLWGQGFWKHPVGSIHPFLVMDWVDGTPLYEWALQQQPSTQRVFQVLAQLASALQAAHEVTAVHRDVKGENVLVRHSDGRAMLTDFGTGNYRAAARVTWQPLPPGTPAYQSPEAGLFSLRSVRTPNARYQAGPADDVYALGVTAYRLVTGEYPPCPEPELAEDGSWRLKELESPDPQRRNPQVDARLSALIVRMLSLSPGARGTARELAEALEAVVDGSGQGRVDAHRPQPVEGEPESMREAASASASPEGAARASVLTERAWLRAQNWGWSPGLVVALAGVLLASWSMLALHGRIP